MRTEHAVQRIIIIAVLFFLALSSSALYANEVDFLNLPFEAKRSEVENLFNKKVSERDGRRYFLRKEKNMQFAGILLYGVYYGFEKNRLVAVEAVTFRSDPVKSYCYDNEAAIAIRKKIISLFGRRIRHVGDYSSSPEQFKTNYADFKECIDRFPGQKDVSCEVDVFERWRAGAKETDRALEAAYHEVSFANNPVTQCVVRLIFRPGRLLSDKLAKEKEHQDAIDELLGIE